jgi:hypothetical protein
MSRESVKQLIEKLNKIGTNCSSIASIVDMNCTAGKSKSYSLELVNSVLQIAQEAHQTEPNKEIKVIICGSGTGGKISDILKWDSIIRVFKSNNIKVEFINIESFSINKMKKKNTEESIGEYKHHFEGTFSGRPDFEIKKLLGSFQEYEPLPDFKQLEKDLKYNDRKIPIQVRVVRKVKTIHNVVLIFIDK